MPNLGNSSNVLMCPSVNHLTPAQLQGVVGGGGGASVGSADMPWVDDADLPVQYTTESSYLLNGWLYDTTDPYSTGVITGQGQTAAQYRFNKEANVSQIAKTPVFADGIWVNTWPFESDTAENPANLYTGQQNGSNPTGNGVMGRMLIDRHGGVPPARAPTSVEPPTPLPGAINVGMFDCHVETARLQNLWLYTWHLNWRPKSNPWF